MYLFLMEILEFNYDRYESIEILKEGIRKYTLLLYTQSNADITDTYIITQQGDRLDNLLGIL